MAQLNDSVYAAALSEAEGVGNKKLAAILSHFGSGREAWQADLEKIKESGVGTAAAISIDKCRSGCDPEKIGSLLAEQDIEALSVIDPRYPGSLRQTDDAPAVLYARGDLSCLEIPAVAIVGSRAYTSYGKQACLSLSRDLSRAGICIVSGLALGIDSFAHEGALEGKGRTIAVLGSGPDKASVFPRANFPLSERILACGGLILSEYPPQTKPSAGTFPARNRIIAGISLAALVVEASASSGSLITAECALEYGRDVFAVPGSIFSPRSEGTNALIQKGAKLVAKAVDVLDELRLEKPTEVRKNETPRNLCEDEERVLRAIGDEQQHIDRIIKLTTLETSRAATAVSMLELKGLIRDMGGKNYLRL